MHKDDFDKIKDMVTLLSDMNSNKDRNSEELIEPDEYFNRLKGCLTESQIDVLNQKLEVVYSHLESARKNGQHKLIQTLVFNGKSILREIKASSVGFSRYVNKDDLKKFIDLIKPRDSVKIIELERYPRIIPEDASAKLKLAKDNNLFDTYYVVFTDYTGKDYSTPEEKKIIQRNRDPILLGVYDDPILGDKGDRFYLIADWVDEYCDLTFDKMITEMTKVGIDVTKAVGDISNPEKLLNEYLKSVPKEFNGNKASKGFLSSFIRKIKNVFRNN
ncbi:hypothetical protein YerA41_073 [Yersinia phage YerA41]|nr:hypothetical protein YerA41_073 [Yersinia phage YerA41]